MVQSFSELTFFSCPKVLKKLSQAVAAPQRGTGGGGGLSHPSSKILQKLTKRNGIKLVGYTFGMKNYVKVPPPPNFFQIS